MKIWRQKKRIRVFSLRQTLKHLQKVSNSEKLVTVFQKEIFRNLGTFFLQFVDHPTYVVPSGNGISGNGFMD